MTEKNKQELLEKLQERVEQFHKETGELGTLLVQVAGDIDCGKLPKQKMLVDAVEKITSVNELRKLCEESYKEFDRDELPESFDEFSAEIIEIEALFNKTEFIETKDFLLRLSAHDENVAELFEQIKKELLNIDIDSLSIDDCNRVMGKYVSLKKMLTAAPEEKAAYMVKISGDFDPKILSLAFTGAYSLADSYSVEQESADPDQGKATTETEQLSLVDIVEPEAEDDDIKADEEEVSVAEEVEEVVVEEATESNDSEEKSEEEESKTVVEQYYGKSIDAIIEETRFEFPDVSNIEVSLEETESQAKKPFSVKKFKESLRGKPYDISVRKVLTALGVYRNFYYEMADNKYGYWPMMCEDADLNYDEAINYLLKKGYIRILSSEGLPKIVGPSKKGEELLKNKTACEYIKLDYNKENSIPAIVNEPEAYLALFLRLQLFECMGELPEFHDSFTECYQITYGEDKDIAYTSSVTIDKDSLEAYLEAIALNTEDRELKEIHVFQYTKDQADAVCSMLSYLNNNGITSDTKIIPHYYIDNSAADDQVDDEPEAVVTEVVAQEEVAIEEKKAASEKTSEAKPKDTKEVRAKEKAVESIEKEEAVAIAAPGSIASKAVSNFISDIYKKTEGFINNNKLYCATAYAGSAAHSDSNYQGTYNKLAYAVNDPAAHCTYTSDSLFNIYTDFETDADYYYQVSAVLRLFFAGQSRYDYNLQQIHDSIKGYPALSNNAALNDLIYALKTFRTKTGFSADKYADYRSHDRIVLEKDLAGLQNDAEEYYDNDFINQRMVRTKTINRRYEATWRAIFSKDSDLGAFLKAVIDDDSEMVDLARDYVSEAFIKEGMSVCADNIDPRKVDELIDSEWEKAIEQVALRMKSSNLFGSVRNNLKQHLLKDVSTICNWIEIRDALGYSKDSGHDAYSAIRDKLLKLSEDAIDGIRAQIEKTNDASVAGLKVLLYTVDEIRRKLDGTYKLTEQKYFYLDFLKTNYVILGDDYLPDFDCTVPSIEDMDMMRLVEKHAENCDDYTLEQNLNDYCCDNYGSAKLISEYLVKALSMTPDILKTLPEAEKNAEEQVEFTKRDFESDLVLAQSYGQLDADDSEDKMDTILNIAEKWYTWAEESHNFGFYNDLLEKIRQQIRNDAVSRGEEISKQLDSLLAENASLERENADYVKRIKETIKRQNYLVAEDMINHLLAGDIPQDVELFEDDYLADFQQRYSYYYKLAGSSSQYLANLVKTNDLRSLKNKDFKGATTLKESWAKPGASVAIEKLRNMLNTLGITVDKIAPANQPGVFNVKVRKTIHEDEKSYGHPVYGFGSVAARDGFRVIWLSGVYNADALISKCNELGKSKHTIAFLDHALTASERRRLARKIKEEGSTKIFGVIDRVLYMYLVHNYSDTYISRMLMETMMPYAYFQPYVYDSATVMPPEMFMGRKDELEKIKDPLGVNIVYGGRQLGKSALLRKAKADINGEEENNRAVLIDIKDLDYKETARKISQTLYDEKIIDEPIDNETDWPSIARTIKNTLKGSKRIRYLLLMLDEADAFLESCEAVNYSPFNALKDIQQSVDSGRFKFVVAGLRNVVRFNKAATSGNSVLPHLEPLIIKPFTTLEARALLEQPLYYLGFRFPGESDEEHTDLVPMILATANYFPGLIQMYCAKLIEALKKNYGGYNENVTPPYSIEEGLIKSVLAEQDFRSQIREKFMITLRVGDDEYYYILALILAYLYRNNYRDNGFSASEILAAAKELETKYIEDMTVEQVDALMVELCELNVMRATADNRYLFSRRSFLSMLGTSNEVEDKLLSYLA